MSFSWILVAAEIPELDCFSASQDETGPEAEVPGRNVTPGEETQGDYSEGAGRGKHRLCGWVMGHCGLSLWSYALPESGIRQ